MSHEQEGAKCDEDATSSINYALRSKGKLEGNPYMPGDADWKVGFKDLSKEEKELIQDDMPSPDVTVLDEIPTPGETSNYSTVHTPLRRRRRRRRRVHKTAGAMIDLSNELSGDDETGMLLYNNYANSAHKLMLSKQPRNQAATLKNAW